MTGPPLVEVGLASVMVYYFLDTESIVTTIQEDLF